MIQWLHISDLHMKNTDDADQQNFYNTLLKDCWERRIQADFIVVTGDLHDGSVTIELKHQTSYQRKRC